MNPNQLPVISQKSEQILHRRPAGRPQESEMHSLRSTVLARALLWTRARSKDDAPKWRTHRQAPNTAVASKVNRIMRASMIHEASPLPQCRRADRNNHCAGHRSS
jgi:hypothetical protein